MPSSKQRTIMTILKELVIGLILFQSFAIVSADIYAAVSQLESLVHLEQRLVNASRNYIASERKKLGALKQFAEAVEIASKLSEGDPLEYIANPINSYLLLKRFTWGWRELGSLLNLSDEKLKDIDTILRLSKDNLPTYDEDFLGAAAGLFRLQETYAITSREMAEGKMKGVKPSPHQLTAADCLELGTLAYKNDKYVLMVEWLEEAERIRMLNVTQGIDRIGNLSTVGLFEHLAWGYYISSNYKQALKYTELALEYNTTEATMANNAKYYKSVLTAQKKGGKVAQTSYQFDFKEDVKGKSEFFNSTYARACRGIFNKNHTRPKDYSKVRCFYKRDTPRLLIKPLKVECVHDNPEIYILYQVLTDKENNFIKDLSRPQLQMAKVFHISTGQIMSANYRISKSAWLFYEDTPVHLQRNLALIERRCSDVSGLSIDTAEELQVVNYGMGGQYEFHKDHGEKGSPLDRHENGNRIATLLFYLSDVEAGGETVFTKAGISLKPRKGDAAFWFNLHRNNTGDWRTEHASCPVKSGSKWVMNKWFHMKRNEMNRPCSLNRLE